MKKEDLTEARIWAMEYALRYFNYEDIPKTPMKVNEETLSKFDNEDKDIIMFLKSSCYCYRPIEMFGLIELIQAYSDKGYTMDEFCSLTGIAHQYRDYAISLMKKYTRTLSETELESDKKEADSVIDELKSILGGYGLEDTQKNSSSRNTKKGGTKQQPFTTNPAPAI